MSASERLAVRSWRRGRPGGLVLGLTAVLLLAAILLALGPLSLWDRLTSGDDAGLTGYRYRFQRATRGTVVRDLQREIAFYQERAARDPQGGLDLAALAGAYLRMARATGELSWYLLGEQAARRSLVNLPFQNTGAVLTLARIAEARHDFAQAIRLAQETPGDEDALAVLVTSHLARGSVAAAGAAADRLVALSPTLGGFLLRALVWEARGRDAEAIADFHRALAGEEPGEAGGSAAARAYLGRFHFRRGRLEQAEALYREALRILPQHPLTLVNLAELELRRGRSANADRHLSQIVTISEASPNVFDHAVFRGLARARVLAGDQVGAQTMWEEAERRLRRDVTSGSFGHRRELARLLLERGRTQELSEALTLMRAEASARRDAEALDILAWALSRAGRWLEARAAMREALRWGVRDAGMLYRAGTIEQALGNPSGARSYFRAAAGIDPTFDTRARRALGLGF